MFCLLLQVFAEPDDDTRPLALVQRTIEEIEEMEVFSPQMRKKTTPWCLQEQENEIAYSTA